MSIYISSVRIFGTSFIAFLMQTPMIHKKLTRQMLAVMLASMPAPPQSLHMSLRRPCSHFLRTHLAGPVRCLAPHALL